MIPAALGAGLGLMLGGQVLSGIGEYQGAKALAGEKERQLREEEQFNAEQRQLVRQDLRGRQAAPPSLRMAEIASNRLGAAQGAGAPIAAAGAQALGLGAPAGTAALQAGAPGIRMQALQAGERGVNGDEQLRAAVLGGGLSDLDRRRQLAQLLYDQREQLASMRGGMLRQVGGIAGAIGNPLAMMGGMGGADAATVDPSVSVPAGGEILDPWSTGGGSIPSGTYTIAP